MGDPSRKRPASLASELASLRIGTCLALLLEDSGGPALVACRMPRELLQWPEGLHFASEWLPLDPGLVAALVWIFRASALLGLLGVWTKWSLLVASGVGAFVLSVAQLVGPTVHNHHLFWFLLLLAAAGSSSGAQWSLDALRGAAEWSTEARSRARVVVAAGRALLGFVYFFPGYWKLATSGTAWFAPEAQTHLFHSKWYQFDFVPTLRIDHFPLLLSMGAVAIVLLELSFPLLVLTRRGRTVALIGGLSFHVLSAQLLGIAFAPLWLCYGLLVDWARVDAWLRSERWTPMDSPLSTRFGRLSGAASSARWAFGVGVIATVGFLVQGLRGQGQAFPWACYPTFQWIVPGEQRDVLAVVDGDTRSAYPVPRAARRRSQREWGLMYRLLGVYGDAAGPLGRARCAYAHVLIERGQLPRPVGEHRVVDLYEVRRSTAPERWNDAPQVGRLLARCPVAGSAPGSDGVAEPSAD